MSLIDPDCDERFIYGHGGKGGYNPFVDDAGSYAAVFAMREESPGGGPTRAPMSRPLRPGSGC